MNAPVMVKPPLSLSLRDAPSLIERVWPAQKISVEAQKERKAVKGQTLTGLGSYWKGRKPLVLVRACILGSLLPSTGNDEADLKIFEILCGLDDSQIADRFKVGLTVADIQAFGNTEQKAALLEEDEKGVRFKKMPREQRLDLFVDVLSSMPYQSRVERLLRPEEVPEKVLTGKWMQIANEHLGTNAESLAELVEQLGTLRFGRRPIIADTFCGGGSIPFEAARMGCEARASDLNPIACLLTWGAINIVGGDDIRRAGMKEAETRLIASIDAEISNLGIEHDCDGNRAKAFLYCLETRCPQTGWLVPMAPSWVISKSKKVIAALVPDTRNKRYVIEVRSGVSDEEMKNAAQGTVQNGRLVHSVDGETYVTSIKAIRGDRRGPDGSTLTLLRPWDKTDFMHNETDIFQERLYAIQWTRAESIGKARPKTFFASVTEADLEREAYVLQIVKANFLDWQREGLIPDMPIEPGEKTQELIRTRGWTYWHHAFTPRDYIIFAALLKHDLTAEIAVAIPSLLNHASKLCRWGTTNAPVDANGRQLGGAHDLPQDVFYNQAYNTFWNYASRASSFLLRDLVLSDRSARNPLPGMAEISNISALDIEATSDIYITDPPYADAVNYHEISEFFIAWLRRRPADPFKHWTWDARRPLAIKGSGEEFRHRMVHAYEAMSNHMPENGQQIVMFTHQDAGVWGDMAQIFWGAGLQVMAAWYIATETTSELKKGGYVQGTVIMVLRKKREHIGGFKDEVVQEVKFEVAEQIDTMIGLNQNLRGHGRVENLFEDADLQMAGYAAALRVLTRYSVIDGIDMTKEALRPRSKVERSLVGEIIDFAVQIANEHMVPEGMPAMVWERLTGAERFFYRMMDVETTGARKLDNYQNFAKAFRVADYGSLMSSMEANKAHLKPAREFKKAGFEGGEFATSKSRALLYAIWEVEKDVDGDGVISHLRELVPGYFAVREEVMALADYVARKRATVDEAEARAARILHGLIRNEAL